MFLLNKKTIQKIIIEIAEPFTPSIKLYALYNAKMQNNVKIKEKFSKLIILSVEKNLNSEIKKFFSKGSKINKENIIIIVLIFGEIGLISSNKPVKKTMT